MTPSQSALDIDAAHKIYRDAIGTPREDLAREYLRIMVDKVRQRSANPLPPWCCASGCQGCTEFQEHSKEQA